jgi:hypothetical protein
LNAVALFSQSIVLLRIAVFVGRVCLEPMAIIDGARVISFLFSGGAVIIHRPGGQREWRRHAV